MADKQVSTVSSNLEDESIRPPNPFVSIISKFTEVFNSRFPPPPSEKKDVVVKVEKERKVAASEVVVVEESKPVSVRFPEAPTTVAVAPPLKEEVVERNNKPVVLWQVYAIGGFFILKWALGRWKEHRANKKPSDQDSPPPSAAAANE